MIWNRYVSNRVGHPFFSKERSDLCVLFRSFKKNGMFFAFFSVLLKMRGPGTGMLLIDLKMRGPGAGMLLINLKMRGPGTSMFLINL